MVNESDHDTAFVELRAVPAQLTALSVELSPLPLNRSLRVLLRPGEFAMIKHVELRGGAHSKAVKVRAACTYGLRARLPNQAFLRYKLRAYKDGSKNLAADIMGGGFVTKKVVRWQEDKRKEEVAEKKLNGGVRWSAADQELFRHRAGRLRRGKKSATDSQLLAAAGIAAPSSSKTHAAPRPPVAFFVRKRRRRRRQRGGEGAAPPGAEAAAEAAPAPAERSRRRGQRRGVVEYRKIGWSDVEESLQERFKKELEADSDKQLLSVLAFDSGNVVFQAGILVTPENVYVPGDVRPGIPSAVETVAALARREAVVLGAVPERGGEGEDRHGDGRSAAEAQKTTTFGAPESFVPDYLGAISMGRTQRD